MRRNAAMRQGMFVGAALASARPKQQVVYVTQPPPAAYGAPPPGAAPPPAAAPPPQAAVYAPPPEYTSSAPTNYAVPPPAGPPQAVLVVASPAPVGVAAAAPVAVPQKRVYFYLVNEANCSVLCVERGSVLKPGVHVVVDKKRAEGAMMQVWYLDDDGVIRSQFNDLAIEGKKQDELVRITPYTGDVRQQWVLEGNKIVNKMLRNNCLGLRKYLRLRDDADVILMEYEGKPYQHWRMEAINF